MPRKLTDVEIATAVFDRLIQRETEAMSALSKARKAKDRDAAIEARRRARVLADAHKALEQVWSDLQNAIELPDGPVVFSGGGPKQL
jgi:acyl-CoA reductase-like NAD-dependent aldehyde dehydrogenase